MKTQNERIRQHLEHGLSITSIEAIQSYGITRLSGRIKDLKDAGMNISSETIFDKKNPSRHWSRYRLIK